MFPRRRIVSCALALLVALVASGCKASHEAAAATPTTRHARVTTTTSTTAPEGIPQPTKIALAAVAKGDSVTVHPAPGVAAVAMTLANPTAEQMPLAMLVVDQQNDWLQVRLPVRPNGTLGWIQSSEVDVSPVDNRIVINIDQRRLRVLDKAQQVVFDTNVAVGKPATPTPLGRFYVDVWLPNPGGPYGKFMLSIAGFSNVLKSFAGGRGQIAMHGWSDTSVMGRNVSNGCVRMRNDDISRLATLAPLGTPVEIIA